MGSAETPVAFVTGAASGIGEGTALHLASVGVAVVCADVQDCSETAEAVRGAGGEAMTVELDVASAASWDAAVASALEWRGSVDWLANIAGVGAGIKNAIDLAEEDWDRALNINAKGTWLGMRAVLPGMRDAGYGAICNVASVVAMRGASEGCGYSASKGAVISMTRQAAVDFALQGIRINAIAPGVIDTPLPRSAGVDRLKDRAKHQLLGRLGTPEEVARVIHFLLSDESSFITGHILPVDGGWTAGP